MSDLPRNCRLFIWFRIFFVVRFYYPIYAVLFLDLGLDDSEFAMLGVVWAVTIVLLEVPSGAMADMLGRKKLVVLAAVLMVAEMIVFLLTPIGGGGVTMALLLINRILSGAAEAMASGADEALAHDSLPDGEEKDEQWASLYAKMMRWLAVAFLIGTPVGAALYDPVLVNKVLSWLGVEFAVDKNITMRLPLLMCLCTALASLFVALMMREEGFEPVRGRSLWQVCRDSGQQIFDAGKWIWKTPAPLILIVFAMSFESVVRTFYTIASYYYRAIDIGEGWFGLIAAAVAMQAFAASWLAEGRLGRTKPRLQFLMIGLIILFGLLGAAMFFRHWGVVFVLCFPTAMRLMLHYTSKHLNRVIESKQRATVLSFRGLAQNVSFALISGLYALQCRFIENNIELKAGEKASDVEVLTRALIWWPVAFFVLLAAIWLWLRWRCRCSLDDVILNAERASSKKSISVY